MQSTEYLSPNNECKIPTKKCQCGRAHDHFRATFFCGMTAKSLQFRRHTPSGRREGEDGGSGAGGEVTMSGRVMEIIVARCTAGSCIRRSCDSVVQRATMCRYG